MKLMKFERGSPGGVNYCARRCLQLLMVLRHLAPGHTCPLPGGLEAVAPSDTCPLPGGLETVAPSGTCPPLGGLTVVGPSCWTL